MTNLSLLSYHYSVLLLPLNAIDITTINVSYLLNLKLYHKPCLNVRCVAALK